MPRPSLVRYAGFTGSVLLAVAAYLGGALPGTMVTVWDRENGPLAIAVWLAGTALLTAAWWAARHGVPSTRWAYLTAGLWLLPLLVAPPLGSRDVYPYACQGAVYAAGENPYHVSAAGLPCQWLDSVSLIWRDTPAPYGPLFVMLAGAAVAAGGSLTTIVVLLRLIAVAGVGLAALFLPALARRGGVPQDRAVWLALACPLVGVHLVSGAHNDALMIGLLIAGLATLPRSCTCAPGNVRYGGYSWLHKCKIAGVGAGVLLGLAVGVKVTAIVVLPFAALAVLSGAYQTKKLVRDGGLVVGGALAAVLAVTFASGLGFGWVGGLTHSGDSLQWTSPSTAVGMTIGYAGQLFGADIDAIPATRTVGVAVLAVVLVVLWWRARHDNPLYGAGLALAATVALSPVFHPWYAIWPLAVLAATAERFRWFAGICAGLCFLVLPDGTNLALSTELPGALAMTALVAAAAVYFFSRRSRPSRRSSSLGSPGQAASSTSRGT